MYMCSSGMATVVALLSSALNVPSLASRLPPAQAAAEATLAAAVLTGSADQDGRVLSNLFRGCDTDLPPTPAIVVAGALPEDLPRGALLRNGPNCAAGTAESMARKGVQRGGWLDGDSMVHCIVLTPGGEAVFSRTTLQTSGVAKEVAAGQPLFDGSLCAPLGYPLLRGLLANGLRAMQPQKDTANTAFVRLGGDRLLALMEQCLPCELRVGRSGHVRTVKAGQTLDGALSGGWSHPFSGGALTAHLKSDPATGEVIGMTYAANAPPWAGLPGSEPPAYARHDVFGGDGRLAHSVGVPLPAPVMLHDTAITSAEGGATGWSVLLDLPLTVRPRRLLFNRFPVEYEPEHGARIGLLPRHGGADTVVWFDVAPCVVLHTVNAHEDASAVAGSGVVTLTALRSLPASPASFIASYTAAFLYEWTLDPRTATCLGERYLSTTPSEFPALDPRLVGRAARFAFVIRPSAIAGPNDFGPPSPGILIDGVVKHDLRAPAHADAAADAWDAPPGWWVTSEPTFVPRRGSEPGDGDEGYLLVVCSATPSLDPDGFGSAEAHAAAAAAAEAEAGGPGRASRLFVLDASRLHAGPVAVVELPGAVPYGLHSAWVPWQELGGD